MSQKKIKFCKIISLGSLTYQQQQQKVCFAGCNFTNRQNIPIQQNCRNFKTNDAS